MFQSFRDIPIKRKVTLVIMIASIATRTLHDTRQFIHLVSGTAQSERFCYLLLEQHINRYP